VAADQERVGGGLAREAFEELLTVHRLKVPTLLRKTLMSTNPIESMFSLVRHSERNITRSRGSAMLQTLAGYGVALLRAAV
jgi:transposase-like protein